MSAPTTDPASTITGSTTDADALVIISMTLSEFFEQNTPETIIATSKILTTLLKNATKVTNDPKKKDMYRKIRLQNPKIQKNIVQAPGALDILGMAGFRKETDKTSNGGDEFFLFYDPTSESCLDSKRAAVTTSPHGNSLIDAICQGLDAKLKKIDTTMKPKIPSVKSTSTFLSEEERKARRKVMNEKKKAKKAATLAAMERWEEDKRDRKVAAERREAQLNSKAQAEASQGLATGITIRSSTTSTSPGLAKPMESNLVKQQAELAAAARQRHERMLKEADTVSSASTDANANAATASSTPSLSDAKADDPVATSPKKTTSEAPTEDVAMQDVDMEARKPAVKVATTLEQNNSEGDSDDRLWKQFLAHVPRCAAAEGIRDSSVYFKKGKEDNAQVPRCIRKLFKELDQLKTSLPTDPNSSIWLRFDEETPQYLRALIAAPLPGPTPYSGGLFAFDIYIPGNYPQVPCKVALLTTGGGRVRFGPNLYADGKVCLSLLGTWSGPGWDPRHSSLYQVLISIQGLILGIEHPFYLEPGHGGWEGDVKEGDFQSTGHTLTGQAVTQELGVPLEVVLYEDKIRVGTVKYAMLEPLTGGKNSVLEAFEPVIQAHFAKNGAEILSEVRHWMDDHAFGRDRKARDDISSFSIDKLQPLQPKLEEKLSKVCLPQVEATKVSVTSSDPVVGNFLASVLGTESKAEDDDPMDTEVAGRDKPNDVEVDVVSQKKRLMQEAASKGDYIRAGELQEEVKRLEDLQRSIDEAAKQNDFIRAGRLQAQLKALTETGPKKPTAAQLDQYDDEEEEEEMSDDDDGFDDHDGFNGMGAGMPPHIASALGGMGLSKPHGLGNNVFAPPGYNSHLTRKNHTWGSGNQLGATASTVAAMPNATEEKPAASAPVSRKMIPPDQLCRLRIRLPNIDKSVIEDFHKNDPLSTVYRRIESLLEPAKDGKPTAVAPRIEGSGAFSQPLSSAGFTLLLTRPKREFSLEMHGTKSLEDLNLAPSATLTVMKCSDRGVMYRGELESRLQGAQGDALDVEGLTYEGLMELTERVGTAAPDDGSAFVSLSREELEQNSETFSPSFYLAELDSSMEDHGEDERKCPICFGLYDPYDTSESLRKLGNCGHVFHSACVETWLRTKSSCPLCKTSIVP